MLDGRSFGKRVVVSVNFFYVSSLAMWCVLLGISGLCLMVWLIHVSHIVIVLFLLLFMHPLVIFLSEQPFLLDWMELICYSWEAWINSPETILTISRKDFFVLISGCLFSAKINGMREWMENLSITVKKKGIVVDWFIYSVFIDSVSDRRYSIK